jgi:transposase
MNQAPYNWKEARRWQAWGLKQQGWSQRRIAEALGVSERAASQWMTRAREGGPQALRHRHSPGAPPRLAPKQLAQLPNLLERGPEAYGFRGQLWTRGRMALESGTAGPASPPARRNRHSPLVRRHLARYPTGPQAPQQLILLIDESGSYPLPRVVRTYAPTGQTTILREWWTYNLLAAISALSPEGKRYCRCQDHALNSADVVAFLEHLRREVPGCLVLIWDGAPSHRRRVIKEFLATGAAPRLHLERLPAYVPALHSGEGLWRQLNRVELRNRCCGNIPHLRDERRDAVKRVQGTPRIIKGFFQGATL